MTVARNIAERLIIEAEGPALDILFKSAVDIHRLRHAPSSELIWSRWSTLPAQSAVTVALALTDTELIDRIAAKEKRKTVRVALAGNKHTHPITRLYFYQEGNRLNDWDLTKAAGNAMTLEELLDYIPGSPTFNRYLNYNGIASALLEDPDLTRLNELKSIMDDYSYNSLCNKMLNINPIKFLDLFGAAGEEMANLSLSNGRGVATMDVETLRRLIEVCDDTFKDVLVNIYDDQPEKLAEIDVNLLDGMNHRRRGVDMNFAQVFHRHDRLASLLSGKTLSFDADAADFLLSVCTDKSDIMKIIFAHPDRAKAVQHIDDIDTFVSTILDMHEARVLLRWVDESAPHLGLERVMSMLTSIAKNHPELHIHSSIGVLSETLGISVDTFVDSMPDFLLANATMLPKLADPRKVFERAKANDCSEVIAAALLSNSDLDEELLLEVVDVLIEAGKHHSVKDWAVNNSATTVKPVIERYKATFAEYMQSDKDVQRSEWSAQLIELFAPRNGWGSANNARLTSASMTFLGSQLKDDVALWESALVLYEGWTGTLTELVDAVRVI